MAAPSGDPPAADPTQAYSQQLAQAYAADGSGGPDGDDELASPTASAYGPAHAPGGTTGLGKGKDKVQATSCKADPNASHPH